MDRTASSSRRGDSSRTWCVSILHASPSHAIASSCSSWRVYATQVPVWAVLDYTDTHCIERELLLAKVSILGPEYLEEQLVGGPTHEPRRIPHYHQARHAHPEPAHEHTKLEREAALVHQFEHSADAPHPEDQAAPQAEPLTPTQALRLKSDNLQAIQTLSAQFGGRIVDVSEHSVIVEVCGKTKRVEAFLSLLKPFGLLESARTGESPPV